MTRPFSHCSRRRFIQAGATVMAGAALKPAQILAAPLNVSGAKVAIARCAGYGPEVRAAFDQCFDLLGGIGPLVKGRTVTVKLNLTGSDFKPALGRPVGESYMTHPSTVLALTAAFFDAGARRVRLVESTQLRRELEATLVDAGFDMRALTALGKVEAENTRNLGRSRSYATLKVPGGGYMFESFDFNRAYADTDVFVSLCKLKTHATAGITLTIKNLFGAIPNSLYGDEAPDERATKGRGILHNMTGFGARENTLPFDPPGAKDLLLEKHDGGFRIPRILADIVAARPIHLGIIDGITSLSRGEGPWINDKPQFVTSSGVLICGLNPVATDAVGTAVMGFRNVRAPRGQTPFEPGDNHLVLAEQAGVGTADLSKIEVLGEPIEKVRSKQYQPCAPTASRLPPGCANIASATSSAGRERQVEVEQLVHVPLAAHVLRGDQ
jgi:uncharacterized protein (DUF362 family)